MECGGYQRRQYVVDKAFQITFIVRFCAAVVVTSILVGALILFSSRDLTVAVSGQSGVTTVADLLGPVILQTVVIVAVISAVAVGILSLLLSHKIIGPAIRMRKEIEQMANGSLSRDFTIRKTDKLQCLSKSLTQMSGNFREKHLQLRNDYDAVMHYLQEKDFSVPASEKQQLRDLMEQFGSTLNFFKT